MIAAVNGDFTGLDYSHQEPEATERMNEIVAGLEKLGPHLVPNFDSEKSRGVEEHSTRSCDCCGTHLHGSRHRFAILGDE
jgi:hypothetical protein